jgi:hypothetical protein
MPTGAYLLLTMNELITIWKDSLRRLLEYYEEHKGNRFSFFPKLFLFFLILNLSCYWFGIFTVFSDYMKDSGKIYYFKIQFPVGFLGALFDSLSFFVTLYIIRRALHTKRTAEYVAHLSIDAVIAVLATFWVLFIFSFSGWLVNFYEGVPIAFSARNDVYEKLLIDAIEKPHDNWRNIYFGIIMGISASLPTCIHISMFIKSSVVAWKQRVL